MIPSYDGNGMFLSLGNAASNPNVGLLFIDFEHPRRLRVTPTTIFVDCPRYIHRYRRLETSPHVPDAAAQAPVAQ